MRYPENIERSIKTLYLDNIEISADAGMDNRILGDALTAMEDAKKATPAVARPNIWRIIMKNRITKPAVAAAIITVAVLGIFEFIDTDSKSSVVWAEVVRKVEASRGLIVRCTETNSFMPDGDDYSIKYFCPTHSRTDTYKDGLVTRSSFSDFETRTYTGLYHTHKNCLIGTITEIEGFLEKHEDWTNPGYIVETILSCEHTKLEQRIIEGVLCEGIETSDPSFLGPMPEVDRLEAQLRLWVDVETRYPVLLEYKGSAEYNGEAVDSESVMDQFQWDVELDPSIFEPNIPDDYTLLEK